jgi:NitT/TauT family transport system permease protein
LFQPAQRNGPILLFVEVKAAFFTLREALVGFLIGGSIGFWLGVFFVRSQTAERAFMPYVVASQTVPILAIAPMVVVWGGKLDIPQWLTVSIIAAYLTFFPVVINTMRGLRSPQPTTVELMRSYASSPRETLWKLQVPAAMPYIFTALKVSAAASVIGAIVGELPAGFRGGLGRDLLQFSQQFTAAPEKLFASVIIAGLAGMVFVGVVTLVEHRLVAAARRQST